MNFNFSKNKYGTIIICIIIIVIILFIFKSKGLEKFIEGYTNISIPNIPVYIINLEKSKQRLKFISKQLSDAKVDFVRFNAIDGNKLNIDALHEDGIISAKWLKKGQVGVAMSHMTLWKTIKTWEEDVAIIFEDDVFVSKDFWKKLKIVTKELPEDWDMVFLGGTSIIGNRYSKHLITPTREATKGLYNTGFFAYMVNKKALNTLLEKCKPLVTAIDNQVKDYAFKHLNVFYATPQIITHNYNLFSDNNRISGNNNYRTSLTNNFLMKVRKIIII
jgi:GR25 family glycosyltransferase involved in LPS biosynthesis